MKNLVAAFSTRFRGHTDRGWDLPHPPLEALVQLADEDDVVLGGGEPTLRPDLPRLLAAIPTARLHTDGLAFAEGLQGLELQRVRIDFHCARQDAHDWLVGQKGAARSAVRAIRTCLEAGLDVEVEVLLTRPTLPHIEETLAVLESLGVQQTRLRPIERRGPAAEHYLALAPPLTGLRRPIVQGELWHAPGDHPLAQPLVASDSSGLGRRRSMRSGGASIDLRAAPTRALRQRMVSLAEQHDSLDVLVDLERPESPELITDCLRLFATVDAVATGSSEHWSKAELRHLRRLTTLTEAK
ncbi:MAG TPA: hypothetical protein QGF58_00840 [Myxococcota bacterium]|nr:hypothetical protein [Myxococcota bacterium]